MSHGSVSESINSGTGPYSPYEREEIFFGQGADMNLDFPSFNCRDRQSNHHFLIAVDVCHGRARKGYYKLRAAAGETDSEVEDDGLVHPTAHSPLLPPLYESGSTKCYLPRRYIIGALLFMVITVGYAIRVAMSVTVEYIAKGTYWEKNETAQSLVLCCFFVGYITTQIISGELARKVGPKYAYLGFFSLTAISTLLLPIAGSSLWMIMTMRILAGMGEGVLFPGTHALVSAWIPPSERATVLTIIWSGVQVGTIVALGTTGPICEHLGWAYVYYIWGALGLVWVVIWTAFGIDSPLSRSKGQGWSLLKTSNREVEHLVSEIPALSAPETPTPWMQLLSSSATWAIVAGHFSGSWIGYILLSFLPKFLKSLHYDAGSYGLIPYAAVAIVSVLAGKLADVAIHKFNVPVVWVRRIWQMIGSAGTVLGLALIAALVKTDKQGALAVALLTLAMGIGGFISSGYGANHIDIGPKYAGPLMGITNSFATIPGIVGVFLTGFILDHTGGSYTIVWIIAMAVSAGGTAIFVIFAKGHKIFD